MTPFLVIDIETGGLDPHLHGLTEIAAVVAEHPGDWSRTQIVDRFCRTIKPSPGYCYEPEALSIQGRTLEELEEEGVPLVGALGDLRAFVSDYFDRDLLYTVAPWAHNGHFDIHFLDRIHAAARLKMPFNRSYRCSAQLWRICGELGLHSDHLAKLQNVCRHYGIDTGQAHTATADVEATATAIGCMMRDLSLRRAMVHGECSE